jgi:3-oxoacyl-[acyl-carrier-protein] synthase III
VSESERGTWLALEGSLRPGQDEAPFGSRIAGIGVDIPEHRESTAALMASTRHHTNIDLERLTGIRSRHVVGAGEDSLTLALGAARDCLAHSQYDPAQLDMVISASITRYVGGLSMQFEPPLSLAVKEAIGASQATSFDLTNACAGMMTGVFILNDLIRQGRIRSGMVVSGEDISQLGRNAAHDVRSVLSRQLASLTLGDAGGAVIVEQVPAGTAGIEVAGFTTLSEHSRLCLAFPARTGPGATMHTQARTIHRVAVEDSLPLLEEVTERTGLDLGDVDYLIPHQTSARAIRNGMRLLAERLGVQPKHVVVNVEEYGNTASTTHFVALHRYLEEGHLAPGDRIMLLSFASGLEVGIVVFLVDGLVERYGHTH